MEQEFLQLAAQYGLPTAAVVFFIWRDWKRELSAIQRKEELDNFIRTTLLQTVRDSASVMERIVITLHERPCLLEEQVISVQPKVPGGSGEGPGK
mgnify:CR=1 FL=1